MKDFFVEDILEKFEDYTQPVNQGPGSMDQEPRNMYVAGGVIKAAKKLLTKTVKPSILRREAVALDLNQINSISKNKEFEQAWKNYKISIKDVGRRKYSKDKFFEMWARENMAQGGQAGQLVQPSIDGSRPGYAGTNAETGEGFQKGHKGFGKDLKGKPSLNVAGKNQYTPKTTKEIQAIIDANPDYITPKNFYEPTNTMKQKGMKKLLTFTDTENSDVVFQRKGQPDPDPAKQTATNTKRTAAKKNLEGRILQLKSPKGYQVHHIMPLAGNEKLNTGDYAVVSEEMNAKMSKYDRQINKLVNEAYDLDYSKTPSLKRVDEINNELFDILKTVKKDLPKEYKGLLGFNKLTPVLDTFDDQGKQVFSAEPQGIDYKKSIAGERGDKIRDIKRSNIQDLVNKAPKAGTPLHNKIMKFCPKDVGGTAGVCSLDEAMRGMKEESKMLKSGKLNKRQAEQIAKKFNSVRRVGTGLAKGSKLMSWLGPYGLGGEIALEGMFVANDMLENGMTYKEALSNSVLRYALPKNQREKLEYDEDRNRKILGNDSKGLAADYVSGLKKQEDLIESYNKFNRMNETEGVGDIEGSDMYNYKDIYKAEKDFGKDYDRMSPTYGKNIFDIIKYGSPEQQAFAAKEEGFDVRAMENRMEYDKKLLGPLGKEDFYSQAQLDMLDAKALSESKRIGKRSNEIKTQEVANFGGVANMAHGGIMNLRRKK